jgi:hypothetical protein
VFVKGGASRLISNLEKRLGESLALKDPNTEPEAPRRGGG